MKRLRVTDPACWEALGIGRREVQQLVGRCPKALADFKALVKVRFRELAMELHPDRNNGDRGKQEQLMRISNANDEIQAIEFAESPTRPMRPGGVTIIMPNGRVRVTVVSSGGGFSFYSETTSTSTNWD